MEKNPKLSIELVWEDFDLEELRLTATNGQYCGSATVYFAQGDTAALRETIQGFPKVWSQVEVFEGGNDNGPRAKLEFRCIDRLGHSVVRVSLAEFANENAQLPMLNEVRLEMCFEPSALDQFCGELDAVGKRSRKQAVLRGCAV